MKMFFPRMKLEPPTQVLSISLLKDTDDPDRKSKLREHVRLNHLAEDRRKRLLQVLNEYNDIFYLPGDELDSEIKNYHDIKLKPDTKPIYVKTMIFPRFISSK